jgi:hypothetical protein
VTPDDPAHRIGRAILDAIRTLPANNDVRAEWVALDAEARRRGKSTRQFRAWCLAHGVELRQENHRDAWVRPADVDRAVAGMPAVAPPPRGDEIDQEVRKAWPTNSRQAPASPRSRGRST